MRSVTFTTHDGETRVELELVGGLVVSGRLVDDTLHELAIHTAIGPVPVPGWTPGPISTVMPTLGLSRRRRRS